MQKKIANDLLAKGRIKLSPKGDLLLDGVRIPRTSFHTVMLQDMQYLSDIVGIDKLFSNSAKQTKDLLVATYYEAHKLAPARQYSPDAPGAECLDGLGRGLDIDGLWILVDYLHSGRQVVFDRDNARLAKISVASLREMLAKEDLPPITLAELAYDPYDITPYKPAPHVVDFDAITVNLYRAPTWRHLPNSGKDLPPRIESFLRHLLGDERSYLYVLSWLRVAILYRNDTVLVMNGAKGTGKGVFSNLLQALVGIDHFAVAPKSLMSGQFNSVLEHKRAIYLDEFKITKENHANVKRITNALQSVEKKGVDAMDTVTYNSFLISNNDAQDMRIEHDDRRFSVIELSNLPLVLETATPDGLWTRDEIAQFELDLAQPDCPEIVSFGHWLIDKDRNDLVDPNNPFRGETFHSLVFDHLTVWKQFIISAIYEGVDEGAFDSGERSDLVLLVDDIRKDFNTIYNKSKIHFPAKDGGLRGFLRSYVHKDIGKIGKLGRDVSGDEAILLDPIFIGDLIQLRDLKVDDLNNNTYSADDGGAEDL